MSPGSIVPLVLGILTAVIIYAQLGWMLTTRWRKQDPGSWTHDGQVLATIFLPVTCLFIWALIPLYKGFIRLITAPQRYVEGRRERKEEEAREARWRQEKAEREAAKAAAERAAEEAKSPAVEIAKINEEMAKLAARKAELERRPDAARH